MASRIAIDVCVYAPALSTTPAKPSSFAWPTHVTRSPSWLDWRHTTPAPRSRGAASTGVGPAGRVAVPYPAVSRVPSRSRFGPETTRTRSGRRGTLGLGKVLREGRDPRAQHVPRLSDVRVGRHREGDEIRSVHD